MHRRGHFFRAFAVLWAVLQFALPAFATVADARLAVRSPGQSHIEEAPSSDCAPAHSPDCALCKQLSTSSVGTPGLAMAPVRVAEQGAVPGRTRAASRSPAGVALPRAPPAHV